MFLFLTITLPILHKCIYLVVKTTITMLNTYIYIDALILYWVQAIEKRSIYTSHQQQKLVMSPTQHWPITFLSLILNQYQMSVFC